MNHRGPRARGGRTNGDDYYPGRNWLGFLGFGWNGDKEG